MGRRRTPVQVRVQSGPLRSPRRRRLCGNLHRAGATDTPVAYTASDLRRSRKWFGLRDSHTGRPWPQVRGHDRRVTCSEWATFVAGATMSRRTAEPAPTPGLILPDARMDLLWDGARLFVTGPDTTARWHRSPGEFPTQRRPHHDDQRYDPTPRTSQHRSPPQDSATDPNPQSAPHSPAASRHR